jgi:hypothetical protein
MSKMQGNKNAEKWSKDVTSEFWELSLATAETKTIYTWIALQDKINESEWHIKVNHGTWSYLLDKFKDDGGKSVFEGIKKAIHKRIEHNITMAALEGKIHATVAIALLNNHHDWSQKHDNRQTGEINIKITKKVKK